MRLLPDAARKYLEDIVATETFEYMREFTQRYVDRGRAEGWVKGEAKALVAVLEARGITVPGWARERIASSSDRDELDTWVRRAATVSTIDALFD